MKLQMRRSLLSLGPSMYAKTKMRPNGIEISWRRYLKTVTIIGVILSFVVSSSVIPSAQADSINPGVFSIDSKPYGVPYAEWTARWWQWVFSIPEMNHPSLDLTGEKCAIEQEGPVWFLTQTFGGRAERTCTIPAGKALLIPIITGECDYLNSPDVTSESGLLGCAMEGNEGAIMEFTIDGMRLKNLENYRVHSQVFDLTITPNNPFRSTPGTSKAIVDGFYVFLEPLSPGRHDIHFTGTIVDVTGPYSYATDVTYHLIVK
jgi:hypothetical protein